MDTAPRGRGTGCRSAAGGGGVTAGIVGLAAGNTGTAPRLTGTLGNSHTAAAVGEAGSAAAGGNMVVARGLTGGRTRIAADAAGPDGERGERLPVGTEVT